MIFEKALVMGTGGLPFQCVSSLARFFDKKDITVMETRIARVSVLEALCAQNKIKFLSFRKPTAEETLRNITERTLVVSAVNIYLFQPWFIQKENITIINYHNSLLPKHRGRNAEAWAIFDGDEKAGITWHFVDDGVDTGRIIEQKAVYIEPDMTSILLLKRQNQLAAQRFDSFIAQIVNGGIWGTAQAHTADGSLHLLKDIPNGGRLDLSWDIHKICRFLRAMDYGAIRTLGYPTVTLRKEAYHISHYALSNAIGHFENRPRIAVDSGQLVILENGLKLSMQLERM